jgi:hypothetical protein
MPTKKEILYNRKTLRVPTETNLKRLALDSSAFRQCTVASLRRTNTSRPLLVSSDWRLSTAASASGTRTSRFVLASSD